MATLSADHVTRERLLFLCIHNSARSQMVEGLLRNIAPDRYEVSSAGLEAGSLRSEAVEVMREIVIDISRQRSKSSLGNRSTSW